MAPWVKTTDGEGGGRNMLEPGEYYFKVVPSVSFSDTFTVRTEEDKSSNGNDQIVLALEVGDENGQVKMIDYLTFTEKAAWRISTFIKAVGGYPGSSKDVELTAGQCIGLSGRCEVMVEKNAKGYDQLKIKRWIEAEKQNPAMFQSSTGYADKIPF